MRLFAYLGAVLPHHGVQEVLGGYGVHALAKHRDEETVITEGGGERLDGGEEPIVEQGHAHADRVHACVEDGVVGALSLRGR